MIKMSSKMESLLDKMKDYNDIKINTIKLKEVLFPRIVEIHECLIIDNKWEINEDEIKFEFIKKMFGNRTMYEISCNEVCMNYYVEPNDNLYVAQIGIVVMDAWKYRLKAEYPNDKFCIIMEVSDTHTILRFHKFREGEGGIIGNNLENNTENAIIVELV